MQNAFENVVCLMLVILFKSWCITSQQTHWEISTCIFIFEPQFWGCKYNLSQSKQYLPGILWVYEKVLWEMMITFLWCYAISIVFDYCITVQMQLQDHQLVSQPTFMYPWRCWHPLPRPPFALRAGDLLFLGGCGGLRSLAPAGLKV